MDNGQGLEFTPDFRANPNPLWHYLWIPQAWSISLELMFYLIVPYLVYKFSIKALLSIAVLLFFARVIFYITTGYVNDPWSYRFFPFELTHFIYGMLSYHMMVRFQGYFSRVGDRINSLFQKLGRTELLFFYTVLMMFLWLHKFTLEAIKLVLSGVVPGGVLHLMALTTWILIIPFIFTLTKRMRYDREMGELSYPIYLIHYSIILLIMAIYKTNKPLPFLGELTTIVTLILAVMFNKFIFRSFESWRQRYILR